MTIISRIAKFSRVDGLPQIDFHLRCRCGQRNRVRLEKSLDFVERKTCEHFRDYDLAQIRQGVVYFRFAC